MIIYIVEAEAAEEEFFRAELPGQDVRFVVGLAEIGDDAEIVSSFGHIGIGADFLEAHPHLRCLAARSRSLERVDLHACRERGVVVSHVPDYGDATVAEHTFALILALSRRLREVMALSQDDEHFSYGAARGIDLCGKTLGIIGLGRVGQRVAALAHAFQMRVVGFDPEEMTPEAATALGVEWMPFEDLLRAAHVISLHASLSPKTHHLLNRRAFARCRHGVLVVNTSRGPLIDTAALDEALESGQVGGAGLDVLEDERVLREPVSKIIAGEIIDNLRSDAEPRDVQHGSRVRGLHKLMMSDSLLARHNVVFTPHVAFQSVETVRRLNAAAAANIRAFVAGKPANVCEAADDDSRFALSASPP
jgi:D-lactate dehydrogenase